MAQATSGEIACADWSRRVTYPSLRFPYVSDCGFSQPFYLQKTTKENFENPQKLNKFSKLSTKHE